MALPVWAHARGVLYAERRHAGRPRGLAWISRADLLAAIRTSAGRSCPREVNVDAISCPTTLQQREGEARRDDQQSTTPRAPTSRSFINADCDAPGATYSLSDRTRPRYAIAQRSGRGRGGDPPLRRPVERQLGGSGGRSRRATTRVMVEVEQGVRRQRRVLVGRVRRLEAFPATASTATSASRRWSGAFRSTSTPAAAPAPSPGASTIAGYGDWTGQDGDITAARRHDLDRRPGLGRDAARRDHDRRRHGRARVQVDVESLRLRPPPPALAGRRSPAVTGACRQLVGRGSRSATPRPTAPRSPATSSGTARATPQARRQLRAGAPRPQVVPGAPGSSQLVRAGAAQAGHRLPGGHSRHRRLWRRPRPSPWSRSARASITSSRQLAGLLHRDRRLGLGPRARGRGPAPRARPLRARSSLFAVAADLYYRSGPPGGRRGVRRSSGRGPRPPRCRLIDRHAGRQATTDAPFAASTRYIPPSMARIRTAALAAAGAVRRGAPTAAARAARPARVVVLRFTPTDARRSRSGSRSPTEHSWPPSGSPRRSASAGSATARAPPR